jgi:hypothetical protein
MGWIKKAWYLQPSSEPRLPPPPNLLLDERIGRGSIDINGSLTGEHIPFMVQLDPYSHRNTIYIPALTVMEVLELGMNWHTTEWEKSGDTYIWRISTTSG